MGIIVSAQCPCGVAGEVQAGSGMVEGNGCLPAWCEKCERLVTAATKQRAPRCKHCRGALTLIQLFEPSGIEEAPAEPITCPRCGKRELRFAECGLWD